MAKLVLLMAFVVVLIQITPISGTTTVTIQNKGDSVQPPVQHFIKITNGTEFPLQVTEDPFPETTTLLDDLTTTQEDYTALPGETPVSESIVLGKTQANNVQNTSGKDTIQNDGATPAVATPKIPANSSTTETSNAPSGSTILISVSTDESTATTSSDDYGQDSHGLIPNANINASIHLTRPTGGEIIFRS